MQIEMDEKVGDVLVRLRSQAAARLMPFDRYLELYAETGVNSAKGAEVTLEEEFDLVLDQLAGPTSGTPSLPVDFSRADIYADHD